jgi:hypothetical protein
MRPLSTILISSGPKGVALALSLALCACRANGEGLDLADQVTSSGVDTPAAVTGAPPPAPPPGAAPAIAAAPDPIPAPAAPVIAPPAPPPDLPPAPPPAAMTTTPPPPPPAMPAAVLSLLQQRCSECHAYGQADLGGWGSVLDLSRLIDAEVVVPGKPEASRLLERVQVRADMPPRGARLSAAELDLLRDWITGLARPAPPLRTSEAILDLVTDDLTTLRTATQDYRYLSLAHFVDLGRPPEELAQARDVLSFVVNSLSRKGRTVQLVPIDPQQSIFRIRLSELGWTDALWDELTALYPYCLVSETPAHRMVYDRLHTEAPIIRGDWLLDTATRSPLYDRLVDLPPTLDELAKRLGVDVAADINHPGKPAPENVVRFALHQSGVALHNRMAERHMGTAGQYLWITYDFKTGTGRKDVFANPLGPHALDGQSFAHTFEQDGGEVIFSMPNGMQGFMLINAQGQKMAAADGAMLRDGQRPQGMMENGLSCFGCHGGDGIIRPGRTDEVQSYLDSHVADFPRKELNEISALYPSMFMPDLFAMDTRRYRVTVDLVAAGAPSAGAPYGDLLSLVGQYESELGLRAVAAELNQDRGALASGALAGESTDQKLPRTPIDPLMSRAGFVCAFRTLAPRLRPAAFCKKTFTAEAVQKSCSPPPAPVK